MDHIINRNKYRLTYISDKLNIKWGSKQKITVKNNRLIYYRKGGPECQKIGLDHKDINSLNSMDFITLFPIEILEYIIKFIPMYIRIKGNLFLFLGCQNIKRNRSKKFVQLNRQLPKRMLNIGYKKIIGSMNDTKYRCIHCEENNIIYEVNTSQKIQQHCRVHYISKFQCKKCNDSWAIKTEFYNHYIYKCVVCNSNFKGLSSCHNHIKSNKHKKHLCLKY
jgi:hypothetical protein